MENRFRRTLERRPGWLQRFLGIGALASDSDELRVRKAVLVLSAALMASFSVIWVATYAALGLWVSAAIPLVYQVASASSIVVFARTHRYILFRESQLLMSLVFPFVLQWSLGGFETSSAVGLWGLTAPLGALLFVGARQSIPWFAAFAGLVAVSALLDPWLSNNAPDVPHGVVVTFFALNLIGVGTTAYALLQYFVRARERALLELAREHTALELEQEKSERLLLNVLPEPVATRLKEQEGVIADEFPAVTVLFADLVGFTPLAERLSAAELVSLLDRIFARWDVLAAEFGAEKIKTIGDAYMVAAGVPLPRGDHAEAIAEMALAMGPEVTRCSSEIGESLGVRIGIDTGPVVAGVIGQSKFSYDLWGDTVNTASRMESHAHAGTIQVTERTYESLRDRFELRPRGAIDVKGKGRMDCYLLIGSGAPGRGSSQ
jgi:class 3 adenylate cyclase